MNVSSKAAALNENSFKAEIVKFPLQMEIHIKRKGYIQNHIVLFCDFHLKRKFQMNVHIKFPLQMKIHIKRARPKTYTLGPNMPGSIRNVRLCRWKCKSCAAIAIAIANMPHNYRLCVLQHTHISSVFMAKIKNACFI